MILLGEWPTGLSYNGAGPALGFTYGNQVAAAFTYNDHLELATLRYSKAGAADLLNLSYDYTSGVPGNNGQIQKIHYYSAPGTEDLTKSENFTYDAWSRVDPAARSRCYESALNRKIRCEQGWDPLPPLIRR